MERTVGLMLVLAGASLAVWIHCTGQSMKCSCSFGFAPAGAAVGR